MKRTTAKWIFSTASGIGASMLIGTVLRTISKTVPNSNNIVIKVLLMLGSVAISGCLYEPFTKSAENTFDSAMELVDRVKEITPITVGTF